MSGSGAGFKDHFSGHAGSYAVHRPSYPAELFAWLAGKAPSRRLAWDCATGNGQAAVALAHHFDHVIATDASSTQIDQARAHPGVEYRVEPAEQSTLQTHSVDLVTVAQAWHWFDQPAFEREAGRVLRPRGVLAAWAYRLAVIEPAIDALVYELYEDRLGAYWPPERRHIENGYRDLDIPWPGLTAPPLEMSVRWTLDQMLGYLGTWSALRRYVSERGEDPLDAMRSAFRNVWGDPLLVRTVRWPLVVRAWRKGS